MLEFSFVTHSAKPEARHPEQSTAVPLLDLQRQYSTIREEVLAAIERVCSSQQFILGAEVEEFEREIATFIGVPSAAGCASGTDALCLTLVAAGGQPRARRTTTGFTSFASAHAHVRGRSPAVAVDPPPRTVYLASVKG